MKKSILILSAFLTLTVSAFGQYKSVVQNDPSGDAGMMGVDVKNLSYQLSADKSDITFKVETYNAVSSWNYSGFLIYIDENLDPTTGMTTECNNHSMKADRCITLMNMMGSWSASVNAVNTAQNGDISGMVTVTMSDSKTTLIKMPMSKIDPDGDGKFNMIFATAVAGSSSFDIDDLPNTGYSAIVYSTPTGTSSVALLESKIDVYPVPASAQLNIVSEVSLEGTLHIMDATGREVAAEKVSGAKISTSVAAYASGSYYFRLLNNKQQLLTTGKFTVQH